MSLDPKLGDTHKSPHIFHLHPSLQDAASWSTLPALMQPQGMARQACFSLPCLTAGHRRLQRRQQSPIYKRPAGQWGLYRCTVLPPPPSRHCFTHASECITAPITCPIHHINQICTCPVDFSVRTIPATLKASEMG